VINGFVDNLLAQNLVININPYLWDIKAVKMAKKKVVATVSNSKKKVVTPTVSSTKGSSSTSVHEPKLFGKKNYQLLALGAGLILLGMILMLGGKQPDPNTWDPDIIYSKPFWLGC